MKKNELIFVAGMAEVKRDAFLVYRKEAQFELRLPHSTFPQMLEKEFGGSCFRWQRLWRYRIRGEGACKIIKTLLPFLVDAAPRAKRVLDKTCGV